MDKKHGINYKTLVRKFVLSILILIFTLVIKQLVIQNQIKDELNTSYIINIAGRQRMLSQKILKDMIFINEDISELDKDIYKEDLKESIGSFKSAHLELESINKKNSFIKKNNSDIIKMFYEIEDNYLGILKGAENFLLEISKEERNIQLLNSSIKQVVENESDFLLQMDNIVFAYEYNAKKTLETINKNYQFLFILIMSNIIFVGIKIFIPMFKYIENSFSKLAASNENLTKIFKNMRNSYFITKYDGEIIFLNNEAARNINRYYNSDETLYFDTSFNWTSLNMEGLLKKFKEDDSYVDNIETTIENRNGDLRTVKISVVTGVFEDQQVLIFNMFDITDQIKAKEILEKIVIRDELTGLYNRYFLENIREGEFERAERYEIPLSALILDIDYFKRINDNCGHPVGDDILKITAKIVKDNIRKSDYAIRIGGEEILILMPNTNIKGSIVTAERIRQAIEKVEHPIAGNFTASFGVAERKSKEIYYDLYSRIDEALYRAKESGRNCIVSSEGNNTKYGSAFDLWNENWDSGEEDIDRQHEELFDMITKLIETSNTKYDKGRVIKDIDQIIEKIREHFDYEEKILIEAGYDDIYNHKKTHEKLIKKAEKIKGDFKKEKLDANRVFNMFFEEIILGHFLDIDIKYFPYIKNKKGVV